MLRRLGCPDDIIFELLAAAVKDCGRDVPAREVEESVRNSGAAVHNLPQIECGQRDAGLRPVTAHPKWPEPNYGKILELTLASGGVNELMGRSPVFCDAAPSMSVQIVDSLFPGNPLLCLGKSLLSAVTFKRESFRGAEASFQFIVPSPMRAHHGRTKGGRISSRCLQNVGPRKFLVVECDFTEVNRAAIDTPAAAVIRTARAAGKTVADICAAVLMELSNHAPLVLVVHSGGKSLHGWFRCACADDAGLQGFMRRAVLLGADRATFCPCQFVRMPDGTRDNGKRQQVIYWNPNLASDQ